VVRGEKAENLTHSLEVRLHAVDDLSQGAVSVTVSERMSAASEPRLTSPSKVLQAIKGLITGRDPGPNSIQNMYSDFYISAL
jgi:hypothetical protein